MTVQETGADTARVTVPATVQREQGISIDDPVRVTIEDIGSVFESITFEGHQTAGDTVTIPAELVRRAGLEHGEQYPVMFEKVDESDEEATDEEVEESVEDELDELFSDLIEEEEENVSEDQDEEEEESEGLGELFG